jgi:uncharacterized repeat protein (TIGR03803 family)
MPALKSLMLAGITAVSIAVALPASAADTYKVLHYFVRSNGGNPDSGVTFDSSGNLYGVTEDGGAQNDGTIFEVTPETDGSWTEKVLYSFCPTTGCSDATDPWGNLRIDSSGNLYGAASGGGDYSNGTVFELSPGPDGTWTEKTLYAFCATGYCPDGSTPTTALLADAAGNLYGTTEAGGANGGGTVFQLTAGGNGAWTEKVLYSFCSISGCVDGNDPLGGLVFDSFGNLYGTTVEGGTSASQHCLRGGRSFCGTVFELTPRGNGDWTEQVLHSFGYVDGENPASGVIFDGSGNLYGTATAGGPKGIGLVFQLVPAGNGSRTENVLHNFYGNAGFPEGGLIFDAAGNLYGNTEMGGPDSMGLAFKLSPGQNGTWTETVLHAFSSDGGSYPTSRLVMNGAGNLYGTTYAGGAPNHSDGLGTVFEITP